MYTLCLPWLTDGTQLPNNYHRAVMRLRQTGRSLMRNSHKAYQSTTFRILANQDRNAKQDRDICRFLWNLEVQETPRVFHFKRVCFGLTCYPFLVMCVMKHHAEKHRNEFPELVSEILENMYIDDLVISIDDLGIDNSDAIKNTDETRKKMDVSATDSTQTVGMNLSTKKLIAFLQRGELCMKRARLILISVMGWLKGRIEHSLNRQLQCCMEEIFVPRSLWAEAVHTAACLLNPSLSKRKLTTKMPYEKWFGKRPTVEHLRVFGRDAYVHIPDQHRKKFDRKARKIVFVRYGTSNKIFRIFDTHKHRVDEVADVKFNGSLQKRLVLIDGEEESGSGVREYEGDERRSRRKNKRREEKTCVIVWYLRRKHPYTEPEHLQ
ncbi:UbiD family decarboxylase [Trichinella spiralis]|uniref:Retrovirus-related Pol polyprotein from transposon TNT 1-94 n=1 Tax=Trichinella spiralis TaxID=6334 RepID=E5SVX1_TRISP|nr:UbiD family decarboxylase [Trichinella spiralis]KRY41036.1 Retrovirus-related Pol polyprotein from transposon TNT 1-94 [Trichinella spiralis]